MCTLHTPLFFFTFFFFKGVCIVCNVQKHGIMCNARAMCTRVHPSVKNEKIIYETFSVLFVDFCFEFFFDSSLNSLS